MKNGTTWKEEGVSLEHAKPGGRKQVSWRAGAPRAAQHWASNPQPPMGNLGSLLGIIDNTQQATSGLLVEDSAPGSLCSCSCVYEV